MVNAEDCGLGDLVQMMGFTHFYEKYGQKMLFYTRNEAKTELCRLFGVEPTTDGTGAISAGGKLPSYRYAIDHDQGKTGYHDLMAWWLPGFPTWKQRELAKPDGLILEAMRKRKAHSGDAPLVVLFPEATYPVRNWPKAYWLRLAWNLNDVGIKTITLSQGDDWGAMPYRLWGQSLTEVVRWMLASDVVVGNDSGPAHIAGMIGKQTLAMCGPTKNVFWCYPSVDEVRSCIECDGCWYDYDRGHRAACDVQCEALMQVRPDRVFQLIADRYVEKRSPPTRVKEGKAKIPYISLTVEGAARRGH